MAYPLSLWPPDTGGLHLRAPCYWRACYLGVQQGGPCWTDLGAVQVVEGQHRRTRSLTKDFRDGAGRRERSARSGNEGQRAPLVPPNAPHCWKLHVLASLPNDRTRNGLARRTVSSRLPRILVSRQERYTSKSGNSGINPEDTGQVPAISQSVSSSRLAWTSDRGVGGAHQAGEGVRWPGGGRQ